MEYVVRMIEQVDEDVQVDLHNYSGKLLPPCQTWFASQRLIADLCSRDMEHCHWRQPKSLAAVVRRGLHIMQRSSQPIKFFHCSIPRSALGFLDGYCALLNDLVPKLKQHGTDMFLGLMQYGDVAATTKMLEVAKNALGDLIWCRDRV